QSPPTLSRCHRHAAPSFITPPFFFFFNDTATTEIYPLSLHDALPISWARCAPWLPGGSGRRGSACSGPRSTGRQRPLPTRRARRSEEHTSELQSLTNIVCRLLL